MGSAAFRDRAIHEGLRYGEDNLVFLRELCQNSRDAGAERISIRTAYSNGEMSIGFTDDGRGMDLAHARKYLFTLYASSKEKESSSAGNFGVGFWSILLFEPSIVSIASKTHKNPGWQTELRGDLQTGPARPTSSSLKSTGTRIEIRKPIGDNENFERVRLHIRAALKRYCRYLRKNTKPFAPLPIALDGEIINEALTVDGRCWMDFRHGSIEGAVGLGKKPRVAVYARGLLVWRGTSLDELRYGARRITIAPHPEGLSPIYVLNGNNLSVTLDRRAVIDDRKLARLRQVADRKTQALLSHYLGGAGGHSLKQQIADRALHAVDEFRQNPVLAAFMGLVAALILVAVTLTLSSRFGDGDGERGEESGLPTLEIPTDSFAGQTAPPLRAPLGNSRVFPGPAIDPISRETQIPLEYTPPKPLLFRMASVETLSDRRGMTAPSPKMMGMGQPPSCADDDPIRVLVDIEVEPGHIVAPVPTGYAPILSSISLDGKKIVHHGRVGSTRTGDTVIKFNRTAAGSLSYGACKTSKPLSRTRRAALLAIPRNVKLPRGLPPKAHALNVSQIVMELNSFLRKRVVYDRSKTAAHGYGLFLGKKQRAGWFSFVLNFGRGDCDVVNTVFVALLRKHGIPARLAIGVVGKEGRAEPGMHAWVEYFDESWRVADATGTVDLGAREELVPEEAEEGEAEEGTAEEGTVPGEETVSPQYVADSARQWISELPLFKVTRTAALVAGIAAAFSVFLVFLGQKPKSAFHTPDSVDVRRVAAEVLTGVLEQPEAWKRRGNVPSRKLLPIRGQTKKMSLKVALSRAKSGRLWHSRGHNELTRRIERKSSCLLDSSDTAFGKFIRRIPGIRDLDEISKLHPIPFHALEDGEKEAGHLVKQMNAAVADVGLPKNLLVPCHGLQSLCRDVDLRGLGVTSKMGVLPLFVGVHHLVPEFATWVASERDEPGLGVFFALDRITHESPLLRPQRKAILRSAARKLFEATR